MNESDGRPTILLVDDDDEVRPLLMRGLERDGFHVVAASDEREAVERAGHSKPGLILLEMGRTPPLEVAAAGRRIRAGAGLPDEAPVVVYAGRADETVGEGGEVSLGPGEYAVLPEDAEQLRRFLRGLMT